MARGRPYPRSRSAQPGARGGGKNYDALLDRMVTGYLKPGLDKMDYRAWKRLNTTPYISDQHGSRFVNVYLNDKSVVHHFEIYAP